MYISKLKAENVSRLFKAIRTLENEDEFYKFFDDLCTISEIQSMAQRLDVAFLLHKGLTYNEITEQTGTSTATISRIARSLSYGSDGYKIVLERLNEK